MTRAQGLRAEVSEIAHESFDGAMVVKTLGREGEETDRFTAKAHELRDVNVRAGRIRAAFDPTLASLPNLGVLVVLAVGVQRVLSAAPPTPATSSPSPTSSPSSPSRSARSAGCSGEFPRSVVGYHRAQRGDRGDRRDGVRRRRAADAPTARRPARGRRARLRLRAGRAAARGGHASTSRPAAPSRWSAPPRPARARSPTCSPGWSTPTRGRVLVDGVDLRELAHGELADSVSVVGQTAFLFDDTVRGNVTLGADVPDDEVWAALRAAEADGFVAALAHGLDTTLGERGTSLSGGQRQRISLARALVRRPRLLILDDATSAVDPEVEARILATLRERPAAAAPLVVVAYRKATIALADEVIHLDDGRIADRGTHDELLDRSPAYARLVNAYEQAAHDETAGAGERR